MIIDIIAGAVIIGAGGWVWKRLVRHWASTGRRF